MNSIKKKIADIKNNYEVVVVGSGYGGGVCSSRLARAGQSVCLLERGREILPPDFPDTFSTARSEVQMNTPLGHLGSALGLYDLQINDEMNALVGCGLGGTSLINANVSLELDSKVFDQLQWPEVYRGGEILKDYYEMARKMLGANPYPKDDLNKLKALQKSAETMGVSFSRPPINVSFEDTVNAFGVEQKACNNCGDCCSGCNNLAKNTTQMNYLPDAFNHGAEIYCEVHVDKLSREGDKWLVHFTYQDDGRPVNSAISASNVMLCAGSFGSTEILLRSRSSVLSFSEKLGHSFSGNGDVLAFGYNNYWKLDDKGEPLPIFGIGMGENPNKEPAEKFPGPCITGVIDNRDVAPLENGRVIEEGVIPGALAMALAPGFFFADAQYGNFLAYGIDQAKSRLNDASALSKVITESPDKLSEVAYEGVMSRLQTYLVMSHDNAGGTLYLDDEDSIRVKWQGAGRSHSIISDNAALKEASSAIQGQFIPNVMWSEPVNYQLVTVHPLGGCAMAESASDGVVSSNCEVFNGTGSDIHQGLYVMDGSVIPTSAGVNPLLTITAISEYAVKRMADKNGWEIDYDLSKPYMANTSAAPVNDTSKTTGRKHSHVQEASEKYKKELEHHHHGLWGLIKKVIKSIEKGGIGIAKELVRDLIKHHPDYFSPGFEFTETMQGFMSDALPHTGVPASERISDDFSIASAKGEADGTRLSYKLTIASDNLNKFTRRHSAKVTGEVNCKHLSDSPMKVTEGHFYLFNPDPDLCETWTMVYKLNLARGETPLYFEGIKTLHQTKNSHWWTDITTLRVRIFEGDNDQGKQVGLGIITLGLHEAILQANTVKMPLQSEHILKWMIKKFPKFETTLDELFIAKFAGFCATIVFGAYGGLLADLKNFPQIENLDAIKTRRKAKLPRPKIKTLTLDDGARIKLYHYTHGTRKHRPQVILAPGFSVTADSFATTTVDVNLVEYLYHDGDVHSSSDNRGYDVWLFAYRASPDSGNEVTEYTIDDIAMKDWPAAVHYILEKTGAQSLQAMVHCVGSMSLFMAIMNGMEGISSIVSSQLTVHPITNWLNFLKADLGIVEMIEGGLKGFEYLDKKIPLRPYVHVDGKDDDDLVQQSAALDVVCWKVPVPEGEACKNPVCRRVFSIFGPSYTHSQLNHATHIAMEEWFVEIATKPFEQLQLIIEKQFAVSADGEDIYMPNVKKLKLPITFLAGEKNVEFLPETSLRTFEWLKQHNPGSVYERKVFPGYAHMDFFIGKTAYMDIFPYIKEALDRQQS